MVTWTTLVGTGRRMLRRAVGLPLLPWVIVNGGGQNQWHKSHPSWVNLLSHKRLILITKWENYFPALKDGPCGVTEGTLESYLPRNSSQLASQGWISALDGDIGDSNILSGKEDLVAEQGLKGMGTQNILVLRLRKDPPGNSHCFGGSWTIRGMEVHGFIAMNDCSNVKVGKGSKKNLIYILHKWALE